MINDITNMPDKILAISEKVPARLPNPNTPEATAKIKNMTI